MEKLIDKHKHSAPWVAAVVGLLLGGFYAFRAEKGDLKAVLGFAFIGAVTLYFIAEKTFKPQEEDVQ